MLNVLLVKRSISPYKNKWSLPGGFVQGDETLEEAARRIFVDETGISPAYLSQFRSYSDIKRDKRVVNQRSGQKARVVTTAFTAIYTSDEELQLDEERVKILGGLRFQGVISVDIYLKIWLLIIMICYLKLPIDSEYPWNIAV